MHVPWGWIKQRPHFIAEGLASAYQVDVLNEITFIRNNLVKNSIKNINLKKVYRIPFSRFNFLGIINDSLIKLQLLFIIREYKYIWITHPRLFAFVQGLIMPNQILIYDCMDDSLEFEDIKVNPVLKNKTFFLEKELCNKADIILASSDYLKNKIINRYSLKKNISIVNNAINEIVDDNDSIIPSEIDIYIASSKKIKIMYIGTISYWIDWDLIKRCANIFKDIEFIFVGPLEIKSINHPQIKIFRPVEHKTVFNLMQKADALMMPFVVNELVRGVNPVKAYEYIHSAKPVILCNYEETSKFVDYVYLYNNELELIDFLEKLAAGSLKSKKTKNQSQEFAMNNTWKQRVDAVLELIEAPVN